MTAPVTLNTLRQLKAQGQKFACLTAYDASFSHAISQVGIEVILVGDSLGMVIQGHDSTLPVTLDDMVYHTRCVARGNQGSLLMADLPFMTYGDEPSALTSAAALMRAGAHMVKLEGGRWLAPTVTSLRRNGIPCCLHMGLTPQSVHVFGGYKVQGRQESAAQQLLEDALILEQAGADLLLLECVPRQLADSLTQAAQVPVIGIGAGAGTDGQVLVLQDMLGLHHGKVARFVKNFLKGQDSVDAALRAYSEAVRLGHFPSFEHGFE